MFGMIKKYKKGSGFTLAEVLITLGIIGVVAVMTIPTLVQDYQKKSWNNASNVFNRKLGEALKVMNMQNKLSGYSSTAQFVEELGKNLKIINVCENVTDCFSKEIHVGENQEVFDIEKLKTSKQIGHEEYGSETVGVQFANGINAIIAYNKNAKSDTFSNDIISIGGDKDNISIGTDALSILYDVSGFGKPNKFFDNAGDIRGLNVALNICAGNDYNGKCVMEFSGGTVVDCSESAVNTPDYKYCGDYPSGNTNDKWAGANKQCSEAGMRLPNYNEALNIFNQYPGNYSISDYWVDYPANCPSAYGGNYSNALMIRISWRGGDKYEYQRLCSGKSGSKKVICMEN